MQSLSDITYDYLVDNNIASEETIKAIIGINGYNMQTLNDILYYFTGYNDIGQLEEEEE